MGYHIELEKHKCGLTSQRSNKHNPWCKPILRYLNNSYLCVLSTYNYIIGYVSMKMLYLGGFSTHNIYDI